MSEREECRCAAPFQYLADPETACTAIEPGGAPAVVINVGDWTKQAKPGNSARVQFSLTQSRHAVTRTIVRLNGVIVDHGDLPHIDARWTSGVYFTLPLVRGDYLLTVEAQDANGCSDGASRPMTIAVK